MLGLTQKLVLGQIISAPPSIVIGYKTNTISDPHPSLSLASKKTRY
jgi:hypothetical protein